MDASDLLVARTRTWVNAFSVLWGGIVLGLFFLVTQHLLIWVLPKQSDVSRRFAAWQPRSLLAVSPTWWSQATIAEVYTFNAVLMLAIFYLLLAMGRRPLLRRRQARNAG